jgi:hypothetical protein
VWLHLKGQEDAMSSGDGAEDEDLDAGESGDNDIDIGGRALDKAEIAAFEGLTSAPADETTALSNVELLSSIDTIDCVLNAGDRGDDNSHHDDDLGFDDILAASRLQDSTTECMFTRSMTDSIIINDNELPLSDSFMRPRTGSVIESGRGDLTASPVRSSTSNISLPRIPSFLRAGASLAKAKLLPWKSGGAASGLTDGQTEYIIEAADLISQAQEHELVGSYQVAFSKYKSGIGILLRGVQSKIQRISQSYLALLRVGCNSNCFTFIYNVVFFLVMSVDAFLLLTTCYSPTSNRDLSV